MSNNVKGILWALIATAMFSITAAMAKFAVTDYPILQILFFRQIVVFLSSLPSVIHSFPVSLKTNYPKIHALRLIGSFVALSCSIWAVAVLPLTTAVTLGFSQVFFVAIIAKFILGENVGVHRVSAVVVGFIGVLIVMRPSADGLVNVYALVPVLGALGAAVAVTSVRTLSQSESTATLLVYQAVFVGVLAGIPLVDSWVTPDLTGYILLISIALFATIGQWVGVKSLRLGEVSVVGNIEYTKLIYAALIGYWIFSETPTAPTLVGAVIIIASSAYLLRREMMAK